MIEWSDDGIVLSARRHGESAAIVSLLTRVHGRHAGIVLGGAGRRARGVYEPGNRVAATWRARLSEHLGHYACELAESRAAALLDDALRLAALTSATALLDAALPEREPHARLYDSLDALVAQLCDPPTSWPALYVRFELDLLTELGFGLDLSRCAATGRSDDLAYVSPKTGRAVSTAAGEPYRDRLLSLPPFLTRPAANGISSADILNGLRLTGFFLEQHVFAHQPVPSTGRGLLPAPRDRLIAILQRRTV
ncbi:MAG TPA: DNA repair protein RecO [Candidatus Angelobacter sp.]|nr:DNA repair protein RecO [Candidatus Angelobacter sp.]